MERLALNTLYILVLFGFDVTDRRFIRLMIVLNELTLNRSLMYNGHFLLSYK